MIKIKLGIVDSDVLYLRRFTDLMGKKYSNQIEMYSFTDSSSVIQSVRENRINVLIVSHDMQINTDELADFCMFAYFTDSGMIDTYNGYKTICRYQRADVIYRQILGLYSEKLADKVRYRMSGREKAHISLFVSCCEGDGAATAAAAFAEYLAAEGKKTLFLNFRQFRDTSKIFSATGGGTFTDVIFSLKSRRVNLTLKLESLVKQSQSGVYFYDMCVNPLDYTELRDSELRIFLDEISENSGYDYIVTVSDFYISEQLVTLFEYSSDIVMVSGDSSLSKIKFNKRKEAMSSIEKRKQINISDKLKIIFNKSSYIKTFHVDVPVIGIQPKLELEDEKEIVKNFAVSDMFKKLMIKEEMV